MTAPRVAGRGTAGDAAQWGFSLGLAFGAVIVNISGRNTWLAVASTIWAVVSWAGARKAVREASDA